MNLATPASVQKLQTALHAKAKAEPELSLLRCCTTRCTERTCWRTPTRCCRANEGAAGVDGQTFEDIEAYGAERGSGNWRKNSGEDVSTASGQAGLDPEAERQAAAAWGFPTIRDRVVQTAAMLVLEPIFEADLPPEQYAYRPDRAHWTQSGGAQPAEHRAHEKSWTRICAATSTASRTPS